jgi:large subunit ribosomal protein L3e
MTHVLREMQRAKSALDKKEVIEAVTVIETPPIRVVGMVGYVETVRGLRALTTLWTQNLGQEFKRRFYKNWYKSKKKCFSKYAESLKTDSKKTEVVLNRLKKYCTAIRLICHTQPKLLNKIQKKANVLEIQINGGDVAQKVDFGYNLFEKEVTVDQVFEDYQFCDVLGVTKGHGVTGVVKRFGVKKLPRKTHRGLRRVGCIGAWHPANVQWTVARTGNYGYHHRTE